MEDTATTAGEAVQGVSAQEFLEGPRPRVYHRHRDTDLQAALLSTLGTDRSIQIKLDGLTKGQQSTAKNRFYRAGKRVRAEHPGLKLRTRVADGRIYAWMEQ